MSGNKGLGRCFEPCLRFPLVKILGREAVEGGHIYKVEFSEPDYIMAVWVDRNFYELDFFVKEEYLVKLSSAYNMECCSIDVNHKYIPLRDRFSGKQVGVYTSVDGLKME